VAAAGYKHAAALRLLIMTAPRLFMTAPRLFMTPLCGSKHAAALRLLRL